MSCGPAIVAILRRPPSTRCRTPASAPPTLSLSTKGMSTGTAGRPYETTGTRSRDSADGSGSAPCMDSSITPST